MLSTSPGNPDASENNELRADTGSAVTGLGTNETSPGIPVASWRMELMAEVATGSTTLVATLDASDSKDESAGKAAAWASVGKLDASPSNDEMADTGSKVAEGAGKADVRSPITFVGKAKSDVSPPRIAVVGSGRSDVRPPIT